MKQENRPANYLTGATEKLVGDGWTLYVTVNFFPNCQIAEIFVNVGKEGSVISGLLRVVAELATMLLQRGVPWLEVEAKLRNHRFVPQSDLYFSLTDALADAVSRLASMRGSQTSLGESLQPAEPEK